MSFEEAETLLVYRRLAFPPGVYGNTRPSGRAMFSIQAASYLINTRFLRAAKDIRADSLGTYGSHSAYNRYYKKDAAGYIHRADTVGRRNKEPTAWDLKLCSYTKNMSSAQINGKKIILLVLSLIF